MELYQYFSRVLIILVSLTSVVYISKGQISGEIVDSEGSAIEGVTCRLMVKNQELRVVKTNIEGKFIFENISGGKYSILISMIGFHADTIHDITYTNTNVKIPLIILKANSKILDQVEITSAPKIITQDFNKQVFNVENSVSSTGGSIIDVLSGMPGVIVDKQSNSIKINGKEGASILINNKPTLLPLEEVVQMLSGLGAGVVSRVEIISNPSSESDANGSGGIINVILKDTKMLDRSFSFTTYGGMGKRGRFGGDLNFSSNIGKINISLSYSGTYNRTKEVWIFDRENLFKNQQFSQSILSTRKPIVFTNTGIVSLGYDRKKLTVLGHLQLYNRIWNMNALNISSSNIGDSFRQIDNEENRWSSIKTTLSTNYKFNNFENISFDFDFLSYNNHNYHTYLTENSIKSEPLSIENLQISKITPIKIYVIKSDYTNKISSKINLKAGIKGSFSSFENMVSDKNVDNKDKSSIADLNGKDELSESILASYASVDYSPYSKVKIYLGARYEYTSYKWSTFNEINNIAKNYWNLFPNISMEFNINNNLMQIGFQKRILRPSFQDLAPFIVFLDPFTYVTGNSQLEPTLSDNYFVQLRRNTNLISFNYSSNKNVINSFQPLLNQENNVLSLSPLNIDKVDLFSLTYSRPLKFKTWWELNANGSISYHKITTSKEINFSKSLFGLKVNLINIIHLPKSFIFELSGFFQTPVMVGTTTRRQPGEINIGIKKRISQSSSLTVSATDIFKTNIWREESNLNTPYLKLFKKQDFDPRTFRISYSFKFGTKKRISVKQLEEQQRLN